MKEKLIFLDTETTGNEIAKDRLCQICFDVDGKITNEYFKSPVPLSVKSMSVHHITPKMIENKPAFIGSETESQLRDLLKEGILVAHNAKFDIAMLENEGLKVPKNICTLRVSRFLDKENVIPEYSLQFLRYFLDLEVEGFAHNAEDDVRVLKSLFRRLLSKMTESLGDEDKAIEKMIEISEKPTLFSKINFGKYKDRNVQDILREDRQYLEWLLKTKLEAPDNDEDWIYTLKTHLGK